MAAVIETLEGLDGKITNKDMIGENGEFNKKSKTYIYAEKVFKLMDNDRDGEINVEEFVKGYQKLKARQVLKMCHWNQVSVSISQKQSQVSVSGLLRPKLWFDYMFADFKLT